MTLKEALDLTGMSLTEAGDMVGLGKSAISRISNNSYPNWEEWEKAILNKMAGLGLLGGAYVPELIEQGILKVNSVAFITTQNVQAVNSLAADLLDPSTTLNASIGMVTGSAGFGKTTTIQHFVANNDQSAYVLYMEGFSLTMLYKAIANELTGFCSRTFEGNLAQIKEATRIYRKLIIIDEADRLPLKMIEGLRNLNEYCGAPVMLVGEESLVGKMETLPRLKSRIRKPQIVFKALNQVDVATYYQEAIGLDISGSPKVCQALLSWSHKDFRVLVNDAQHIVKMMNTSGQTELTEEVIYAYRTFRS